MTQCQMFIRAAFQFEFRKKVFDARIKTLIVRHHDDDISAIIQQVSASLQSRNRITRVLQDVQHRDDVILMRELNVFQRAVMNRETGLLGHILADVL